MKSAKTTPHRLQSSLFRIRKSLAPPVLALLSMAAVSAQQVTLLSDDFSNALRVENPASVFTGVDADGLAPIVNDYAIAYNNLSAPLARTTAIAPKVVGSGGINGNTLAIGSGAVAVSLSTYFAPTELGAGDSISVSLNVRTSAAPSALATTFRIGLFDSNGGGNLVQNTTYIDSAFTDDRGYAAFFGTGTAVTHDVRERTASALQNIFRPTDFTLVGTAVTASNSVLANTTYPVTLHITRSLDGLAVGITGTFNGVTVSATDAAALVTDFDHLAIQFGSQFGGTEWIDDVVVTYTPAPPLTPDMLAYYPFDNGFNDASGNNNHLVKSSGSPGITNTPGQLRVGNGALNLNQSGTQQHLRFTAPLDFDGTRAWAMAWWGKRSASGLTSQGMIAGTITDSNDFVWTPNAAGVVQGLRLRNGSAFNADYNNIPDDNAFHHWAVSYNGTGQVTVWRDNVSLGTKAFSGDVNMTHVGAGTNSNTHSFFGQIDDLYFYDGAINAANVNELFTTPPGTLGFFLCERWNNTLFNSTNELVGDNRFYGTPDITRYDKSIATSSLYQGTYFSTRARGWITAPETGGYRFWISGRNGAQLLLSTAGTKYTKQVIAELNPELGTGHGVRGDGINIWDNYPSQMSEEIQLTAGQNYYLETLQTVRHPVKAHASIAWAPPGMARTPLDLACVQPYAPTADDADDDYLPDAWETQYGLDPLDNGLTDIIRQGERGDFDGDGLSNREEYLAGIHPGLADSDCDGLSDREEVRVYGTDPKVSDATTEQLHASVAPSSVFGLGDSWTATASGVLTSSFRGKGKWNFTVDSAGFWVLQIEAKLRGNAMNEELIPVEVSIDGHTVSRSTMTFLNQQPGSLRIFSPYLAPGPHELELFIDNRTARVSMEVTAIKVLVPGGLDLDGNGRSDAVEAQLATLGNVSEQVIMETCVSPAFIEGRTRSLDIMELRSRQEGPGSDIRQPDSFWANQIPQSKSAAEQLVANLAATPSADRSPSGAPLAALAGPGHETWFAKMPLTPNQVSVYSAFFENGGIGNAGVFVWRPLNLLNATQIELSVGSTLLMGAWNSDNDNSPLTFTIGAETRQISADKSLPWLFSQAGDHTVTVLHQASGQTFALTVHVRDAALPANLVVSELRYNPISLPAVAPDMTLDSDGTIGFTGFQAASGGGSQVTLMGKKPGSHRIAARMPANGAILDVEQATVIGISDGLRNLSDTAVSIGNGFYKVRSPLLVTNLPAGATVRITIFAGGVTFLDGTTVKVFTAADFDENGLLYLEFLTPQERLGAHCHYVEIFDAEGRMIYK